MEILIRDRDTAKLVGPIFEFLTALLITELAQPFVKSLPVPDIILKLGIHSVGRSVLGRSKIPTYCNLAGSGFRWRWPRHVVLLRRCNALLRIRLSHRGRRQQMNFWGRLGCFRRARLRCNEIVLHRFHLGLHLPDLIS